MSVGETTPGAKAGILVGDILVSWTESSVRHGRHSGIVESGKSVKP